MALTYPSLVGYATESFTPSADLSGGSDIRTRPGVLASGNGVVAYLTVLAVNTATGKYVPHDPTSAVAGVNVAVALAGGTVDTTGADQNIPVITAGDFNVAACTFHASLVTEAAKIAVFGPAANVILRHLSYGV